MAELPDYVIINDPQNPNTKVLREKAVTLTFPLSDEDWESVRTLEAKYDQETNCAGLAAPQIGIGKAIIVFEVPDDPQLKKWRPDLIQSMPKTIWINPSYEPMGEEKNTDYEGCFSVLEVAGPVGRYKKVRYKAYTPEGKLVEGIAEGFLARLIQHEIDHVNGRCYIDLVPEGELLPIEEYRRRRREAMEGEGRS